MYNIKTGYFEKINDYINMEYSPVAICGRSPDWYCGPEYKKLAPKWDFFNK